MKGGFQKQIKEGLFEVSSNHEYDCGACMLKYFGASEELIDIMTALSEEEGLDDIDVAKIVQDSINSVGHAQQLYGGEITCRIVSYPLDENGNFFGWRNKTECLSTLDKIYSYIDNGYACMALIHRPFEGANPSNPYEWNQVDFGHYVVMGKAENGMPLLLDTQRAGRKGYVSTYRNISEIYGYLSNERVHGISIIECYWSPDTTFEHPEKREYYEGEGVLGTNPILLMHSGGKSGKKTKRKKSKRGKSKRGKSKRSKSKRSKSKKRGGCPTCGCSTKKKNGGCPSCGCSTKKR